MIAVQFAVVLAAIFIGARAGGIAIGFAGGLGVLVLAGLTTLTARAAAKR